MATLSFKVLFNDQARRFKLTDADFATFQAKAKDVLGLSASQPIFQWKDSDDDYITINSQEEFDEAVAEQTISSASSVIKIYVSESTSSSPVPNPSQEPIPHTTTSKDSNLQDHSQEESKDSNPQDHLQEESNKETKSPKVQQQEQEQDSQAQQDPTPSPPPPPEPVTHPHVECDGSGQSPLRGIRFHKIGENYDLNEAEFSKLDESEKTQFELILYPGAQPIRWEPVVHYDIVCDASNMTPVFGIRFHKIGENYDLSFTEFTKLSEEEKRGYELLNHPRAKPIPYYTPPISEDEEEEAFRQLVAAMVGGLFNVDPNNVILKQPRWQQKGCPRQRGCPRRCNPKNCRTQCENSQSPDSQCAKNNETSSQNQSDHLPQTPAAIGSYGPGIVRLQKFLIEHDLMDASAIRWRAGVFGPRTQEAIYKFQLANNVNTKHYGVYDEPTAAALQALVKENDSKNTECATPIDATDATENTTNVDTSAQLNEAAPPQHEEVATTQTSTENNDKTEDTTESQHNKAEDDDLVVVDSTDVESVEPVEPTREPTSVSSQLSTSAAAEKDWTEELKILKSMGFVNEKALVHLLNHNKEADPSRPLEATIAALLR